LSSAVSPVNTISLPSGPKIFVKASTSNFSAAPISASAASRGVANVSASEAGPADAETVLGTRCCPATNKLGTKTQALIKRMKRTWEPFALAEVMLISLYSNDVEFIAPLSAPTTAPATEASTTPGPKTRRSSIAAVPRIGTVVSSRSSAKGIAIASTAARKISTPRPARGWSPVTCASPARANTIRIPARRRPTSSKATSASKWFARSSATSLPACRACRERYPDRSRRPAGEGTKPPLCVILRVEPGKAREANPVPPCRRRPLRDRRRCRWRQRLGSTDKAPRQASSRPAPSHRLSA